ncbi:MAG: 30S ribosome-binding factor RbfA, partial [Oscillospiraceae bacterium]
ITSAGPAWRPQRAIVMWGRKARVSGAMLSIVKLDLARDLTSCKVYLSSINGFEAAQDAVKVLKIASGFIRHELGARVELRHTPELRFVADNSIEHSADIARMLNQLEAKPDAEHQD